MSIGEKKFTCKSRLNIVAKAVLLSTGFLMRPSLQVVVELTLASDGDVVLRIVSQLQGSTRNISYAVRIRIFRLCTNTRTIGSGRLT